MKWPLTYLPQFTSTNTGDYRYLFNGQEADNEIFGDVTSFGYEFRQYDSRLGRFWSVDPKWNEYPGVSPYAFCNDSPVMLMDPNGETSYEVNGERRWINDGRDNITIHNVTRHQFNRLRRNFARDMDKYNRLHEKYKVHNGYTENTDFGVFSIGYNNSILLPEIHCTYYAGKPYPSELARQKIYTVIQKLDEGGSGDAWERDFAKKSEPYVMGIALINPLVGVPNAFQTITTGKDIFGIQANKVDKGNAWINIGLTTTEFAFPELLGTANLIYNTISSAFSTYKYNKKNQNEGKEK